MSPKEPPNTGPTVIASSKSKLWRSRVANRSAAPSSVRSRSALVLALFKPHARGRLAHPQQARGHARYHRIRRDVARDHGVRAHHRVVANGHAAEDARAVADPDVVPHAHVALVDALKADRAVHLDHAVVEVDQHYAVRDHAFAADRDVLVGRDRALLPQHGLRADRDRALVAAELAAVADPRPAAQLDRGALAHLEAAARPDRS